ncbi:Uu.00g127440.m01.CDS01 [Anthostomella pinea]|uniref:Uu.00g127440.m01.CDS01 n=1 Tax=Anthostomella pinea TaxID=933095 RepID=A0AAI8VJ27_9PEZI|nr:Uu.00g127440.m01.CDS01 [Anthostomella pinea]
MEDEDEPALAQIVLPIEVLRANTLHLTAVCFGHGVKVEGLEIIKMSSFENAKGELGDGGGKWNPDDY